MIYEKYAKTQFDKDGKLTDIKITAPENFNFGYDVVDVLARKCPDKTAVLWCNDIGEEKALTFKDIKILSNKTANWFLSKGIKKGDAVLLIMGRHYSYWYTVIALHKIGALPIPCSNQLSPKDIDYRVKKANVKLVIYPDTINLKGQKSILKRIPTKATDEFLAYFTSGTTGQPKCAVHNHLYPLGHIATAAFWQRLSPESLHFTLSDSGWGKCAWGKLYGQWLCEATVFVYDFKKFSAPNLTAKIKKYGVTSFCAAPTVYRFFAKEGIKSSDFKSVRHLNTAGEALNSEVFKQIEKSIGKKIYEGFGQTETTCVIGFFTGDTPAEGSMGRANPLYDVRLINDEICINLNHCRIGIIDKYITDEGVTELNPEDGIFHTGDLARLDENGNFYYIGRKDDTIKSSGYRISPFEVESILTEHPAVRECAVIGVEDEIRGIVIKACIVLTKAYKPSDELKKELQEFVKNNTAAYKYPRVIEFFDALPKTASGKIKRAELRQKQ